MTDFRGNRGLLGGVQEVRVSSKHHLNNPALRGSQMRIVQLPDKSCREAFRVLWLAAVCGKSYAQHMYPSFVSPEQPHLQGNSPCDSSEEESFQGLEH